MPFKHISNVHICACDHFDRDYRQRIYAKLSDDFNLLHELSTGISNYDSLSFQGSFSSEQPGIYSFDSFQCTCVRQA